MSTATVPRFEARFTVEIEVWVTHRSAMGIMHISDPPDREWRAAVRHSSGLMEWQWCGTFDEAVAWCRRYAPAKVSSEKPVSNKEFS